MTEAPILLVDDPAPHVRRLPLNRPAKRNALSNPQRGIGLDAVSLHQAPGRRRNRTRRA
jgi:hypothetical protein